MPCGEVQGGEALHLRDEAVGDGAVGGQEVEDDCVGVRGGQGDGGTGEIEGGELGACRGCGAQEKRESQDGWAHRGDSMLASSGWGMAGPRDGDQWPNL